MKNILLVLVIFSLCSGFQIESGMVYSFLAISEEDQYGETVVKKENFLYTSSLVGDTLTFSYGKRICEHYVVGENGLYVDTTKVEKYLGDGTTEIELQKVPFSYQDIDSVNEIKWFIGNKPPQKILQYSEVYGPVYQYFRSYSPKVITTCELMGIKGEDSVYLFNKYYENRVCSLKSPFNLDTMYIPLKTVSEEWFSWPKVYKSIEYDCSHYIEVSEDSLFTKSIHLDTNCLKIEELYSIYGERFYSRNYVVDQFAGDTLWSPVTFFVIYTSNTPDLLFPINDTILNAGLFDVKWAYGADSLVNLSFYKGGDLVYEGDLKSWMQQYESLELSSGSYRYVMKFVNGGVVDSVFSTFTLVPQSLDAIQEKITELFGSKGIKEYLIKEGTSSNDYNESGCTLHEDGFYVYESNISSHGPYPVFSSTSYRLWGDWSINYSARRQNPDEEYQRDTIITINEKDYPSYLRMMMGLYKTHFDDTLPEVYPILNSLLLSCKEETAILHDSNQLIDMGFPVNISTINKKLTIRSMGKDVTASLVSVSGRSVWKLSTVKANSVFVKDLSSLSEQVYFLVLKTENKTKTVKLIK